MTIKFKSKLKGQRITLKRTCPTFEMAKTMFEVVDNNRPHLSVWFPWCEATKKLEDTFKYLLEKEEKTENKKEIEYGIYLKDEYIGNIAIFNISEKNKVGEIGYWISAQHTRHGYMSEAVRVLEKEGFENLGLNRIQIKCDERNIASAGVAKKCDYVYEGTIRSNSFSEHFQDFRNTLMFSKLKSEYKV